MVDTDRSSWQKLSAEFEEEGYTDLNVNGHEFYKKGGVDKGDEHWHISPKAAQVSFSWSSPSSFNMLKYSSLASAFNVTELENSRFLRRIWRVAYLKEAFSGRFVGMGFR